MLKSSNPFEDLQHLVLTPAWVEYLKILEERKVFLQKEVLQNVREQNLMQAYATVAKIDDIDKTLQIISKKLKEQKGA